ncbi:MAG: phage holin, LLH family [Eubacteriales bacterium]
MIIIDIILCLAILMVVLWYGKKGETEILKTVLLSLVVEAEKQYGNGTGAMKLAVVIDWIYQRIPSYIKPFFTAEELTELVNKAVTEAQVAWQSNSNLKEYITPATDE